MAPVSSPDTHPLPTSLLPHPCLQGSSGLGYDNLERGTKDCVHHWAQARRGLGTRNPDESIMVSKSEMIVRQSSARNIGSTWGFTRRIGTRLIKRENISNSLARMVRSS